MDARVLVELGMEGEGELFALLHGHDVSVAGGQGLHAPARLHDERRADERCRHGAHAGKLQRGAEAAELPAVGVAAHEDVQRGDARRAAVVVGVEASRKQDEAGAGGEHGHAVLDALAQGLEHAKLGKQLALRG